MPSAPVIVSKWGRHSWITEVPAISTTQQPLTARAKNMALTDFLKRGTRAAQPAAASLPEGTLYYVTDESKLEQVVGGAWVAYS